VAAADGAHPKIVCVGFNYAAHASESGRDSGGTAPAHPTLFTRFPDSLVGAGTPVVRPFDDSLDWNSVRTWQLHSGQATAGKNWAATGTAGPWLTTTDELGTAPLRVTTRLNGAVVQDDTTDRLTFGFADIITYVSTFTPLRPGDLIATGTPKGIGFRMSPPRFLRPGDEVEGEVSGVGVLRHGVIDSLERVLTHEAGGTAWNLDKTMAAWPAGGVPTPCTRWSTCCSSKPTQHRRNGSCTSRAGSPPRGCGHR
jgi:2-keto-4-pentenoate hydratase/2-oxohepta-3-ene-1,7-dioic acid hydratase in catechol pathway